MFVVVADVIHDQLFELVLVPDDGAVEEFAADGSDPPLCVGVGLWRPDRGLEDVEAFGAEYLVERVDELATSITNERL